MSEPAGGDLFRHTLFFLLGIGAALIAVFAARGSRTFAATAQLVAALLWIGSGIFAIRGRRHVFGRMRLGLVPGSPGPSGGTSPVGAVLVGAALILVGLAGIYAGAQLLR